MSLSSPNAYQRTGIEYQLAELETMWMDGWLDGWMDGYMDEKEIVERLMEHKGLRG